MNSQNFEDFIQSSQINDYFIGTKEIIQIIELFFMRKNNKKTYDISTIKIL